MLEKRRKAADQVAQSLFAAESAIDAALAKTAALAGIIPAVREEAQLAACVGQEAVEQAIETLRVLAEARRSIVKMHEELATTQKRIGLGAVSFGGLGKHEEQPIEARLRAVKAA
jgi:hypothetical protein